MPNQRRKRKSSAKKRATRQELPRVPFIDRKIGCLSVLSEEGLQVIEANAERILSETGMEFRGDNEVLTIFSKAGCDVDCERVRFVPGFCRQTIMATAPAEFMQLARNPENSVRIGGSASILCPSWGPPFAHDEDQRRRI